MVLLRSGFRPAPVASTESSLLTLGDGALARPTLLSTAARAIRGTVCLFVACEILDDTSDFTDPRDVMFMNV